MDRSPAMPSFTVVETGENSGHCDCCGHETRSVWGWIDADEATVAAYWVRWTVAHPEQGTAIDLCIGAWGEAATPAARTFVSLLVRQQGDHPVAVMVVDAELSDAKRGLAAGALRRDEVIGTPLAPQVFALFDAIWVQDTRCGASADEGPE